MQTSNDATLKTEKKNDLMKCLVTYCGSGVD